MAEARGGTIFLKVNGVRHDAKGNFTYNTGKERREAIVGSDGVHDFKLVHQQAFIEGEITDRADLVLEDLVGITGATVTLELANGKVIALQDAWYAGEGTGNTEEGNIPVRFESSHAEEIR